MRALWRHPPEALGSAETKGLNGLTRHPSDAGDRSAPDVSVPPGAGIGAATLRVGAVSYTNTLPLLEGLDDPILQRAEGFSLALDLPAVLADQLKAGHLDIALIPVAEFLRGDYLLLKRGCIACIGPVRSVVIVSDRPLSQVKRLLLDGASRSSVGLTRVLLKHLWNANPELVPPKVARVDPPTPGNIPEDCDAELVIGDRALRLGEGFAEIEDLGEAWFELTNLPFVFAVWAVRRGVSLSKFPTLLTQAYQRGRETTARYAEQRSAMLGVPPAYIEAYLTEYIRYRVGDRELAAIEMYYRFLKDMGLCPEREQLEFYPNVPTSE